jgi:hypothetical protein
MKNQQVCFLIFILSLFVGRVFAFSDRGMLPEGHEWRECQVGMVIDCKTTECDSICASKLAEEKDEKEGERLEEAKELIDEDKNLGQQNQSE